MFSKAVLVRFLGPPCLEVKINRWWTIMILLLSASELSQLNFGPTKTITPHDGLLSSLHIKTFTHLTCFSCYCGVNCPSIFFPLRVRFVFIAFLFYFFGFRFGFILFFSSWCLSWNCKIVILFYKIPYFIFSMHVNCWLTTSLPSSGFSFHSRSSLSKAHIFNDSQKLNIAQFSSALHVFAHSSSLSAFCETYENMYSQSS